MNKPDCCFSRYANLLMSRLMLMYIKSFVFCAIFNIFFPYIFYRHKTNSLLIYNNPEPYQRRNILSSVCSSSLYALHRILINVLQKKKLNDAKHPILHRHMFTLPDFVAVICSLFNEDTTMQRYYN